MKVIACFVLLLTAPAFVLAESCLSAPFPLGVGAACNGGVNVGNTCAYGLYCGKDGTCATQLNVGDACDPHLSGACPLESTCKGPVGSETCVANASPGEACSNSPTSATPSCGVTSPASQLVCNGLTNTCIGGLFGDSCKNSTDCSSGKCTNNLCDAGILGDACYGDSGCRPGLYCDNGACANAVSAGQPCTTLRSCSTASGYMFCTQNSYADKNTTCKAIGSLATGAYCDGVSALCVNTYRCTSDNYCAQGRVSNCQYQTDCSADEVCQCGVHTDIDGFGNCRSFSCAQDLQDYALCILSKCGITTSPSSVNPSYANSCVNLNCKTQAQAYFVCSPASFTTVSLFATMFFALIASMVSF